jgi:hypothetical protein|tara:strand:- start:17 stop:268 length:252 start_codon:yes stop_codon:yes gene_type:complete
MLIIRRIVNFCEIVGYARAASELSRQGFHDEAKHLLIKKLELQTKKETAIVRLEKLKAIKRSYDPSKHYLRGKQVAFWKGKAA